MAGKSTMGKNTLDAEHDSLCQASIQGFAAQDLENIKQAAASQIQSSRINYKREPVTEGADTLSEASSMLPQGNIRVGMGSSVFLLKAQRQGLNQI